MLAAVRTRPASAAVTAFVLLAVVIAGCGSAAPSSTITTALPPSASTSTPTSSSTTTPPTVQPDTAIWPFAASILGYQAPVEAARTFAVNYLGFVDPVIGPFQPGDSRSGEVSLQPAASAPVTTVLVRKLTSAGTWWVVGAATANLRLESPTALAAIASPVVLSGQSTAFEATVNVQVRQDGSLAPLKEDIVMGGANGVMGPFSKAVAFPPPTSRAGAIVMKTMSAKDGTIWEATVIRVSFSS